MGVEPTGDRMAAPSGFEGLLSCPVVSDLPLTATARKRIFSPQTRKMGEMWGLDLSGKRTYFSDSMVGYMR